MNNGLNNHCHGSQNDLFGAIFARFLKGGKMAKKRGQNQGSIVKRENGTYMVQLSADGKRITKYFQTKTEANKWRIDTLHKIQRGLFYSGPKLTVSEFLEEWLIARKGSIKPKTLFQYRQIVELHINPILGNIKMPTVMAVAIAESR